MPSLLSSLLLLLLQMSVRKVGAEQHVMKMVDAFIYMSNQCIIPMLFLQQPMKDIRAKWIAHNLD